MPEFQLDYGGRAAYEAYKKLDLFTQGYIEALFFTNTGSADDEDLENAAFSDLAPSSLKDIVEDCKLFQMMPLYQQAKQAGAFTDDQAGRDFWYTRNGHGVGFWDRSEIYGGFADHLSEAAEKAGEKYVSRGGDDLIYVE